MDPVEEDVDVITPSGDQVGDDMLMKQVKSRMAKVSIVNDEINEKLEQYRQKMCRNSSVHRKKTAINTLEKGTAVIVALDHDNNILTRKRKLQFTFSQTGVLKRVTANNKTAIVTIDGVDTPVPVNRMQVIHKSAIANQ
ncbi:366_t:CDS:1, partial [Ambispora gerdemannii]